MDISRNEYDQRLSTTREAMARANLSALLVSDPANIYYLTGYNAWSFYTPQAVFIPAEGAMVLFTREMDAGGAHRTTWLPRENIHGYPERLVHRPLKHPFDWVGNRLRELGVVSAASAGQVGLDMDAHFFSPKGYFSLVAALPEWDFVDSQELINWVRVVKSPAEIASMRIAGQVCTNAMDVAINAIRVGVRQCDVAAEISRAQIVGTPEHGGDYPAIVPMIPMGDNADTPHLTWTDERFSDDQSISVEIAGAFRRYHTPLARTIMLGRPNPQLQNVVAAVGEGMEMLLDTMRPGLPVIDLCHAWDRVLARYSLSKPSRIGYSIGIGYPPDWGERTVSLRTEDETVLQENMTFHVMCGMWMDGYGYELSESVRVTADGVETFTNVPRGLIQKGS